MHAHTYTHERACRWVCRRAHGAGREAHLKPPKLTKTSPSTGRPAKGGGAAMGGTSVMRHGAVRQRHCWRAVSQRGTVVRRGDLARWRDGAASEARRRGAASAAARQAARRGGAQAALRVSTASEKASRHTQPAMRSRRTRADAQRTRHARRAHERARKHLRAALTRARMRTGHLAPHFPLSSPPQSRQSRC